MLSSILVPVDGSRFSEHSLPLALALARRADAELHIVRVHDPMAAFPQTAASDVQLSYDRELDDRFRQQEEEHLRGLVDRAAERAGVAARADLLDGPVVEAIHRYAADIGAGLIVMTTHGRGGLSRAWLGSVADGLLRESRLPMLLLRPEEGEPPADREPEIRSILLPLDGSDTSEHAIEPTAELARLFGARVSLLRVIPPAYYIGSPYMATSVRVDEETVSRREQEAEQYLAGVARTLRDEGLTVEHAILTGASPAQDVLEHAAAAHSDLIAMATHGRGGWRRVALGSVTDKVVRAAETPVLAVPNPAD